MHSIDLRLKVTRKLISNNDSRLDSGSTNVYSFISVTVLLFNYLFLWSWAGGILRILQSHLFRERAVFSYPLTAVMVTNYAKRRVRLQIERAKFQFVLIVFCKRAVLLFNFERSFTHCKNIPDQFILLYFCWYVDETMCKIKTWLFSVFLKTFSSLLKIEFRNK